MVVVAVPLAAIARLAVDGVGAQLAGKAGVPVVATMLQVTAIVPAKPLTEVKVTVSVLPVVAPEVKEGRFTTPGLADVPVTVRLAPAEVDAA